jgi:hypothetical protein
MLAEKFLLYLETLQSRVGSVGNPVPISTSPHVAAPLPAKPDNAKRK